MIDRTDHTTSGNRTRRGCFRVLGTIPILLPPILHVMAGLLTIAGCSDGRPELVPVTGRVTIDGEPLTRGVVRFATVGGRMSGGALDEQGKFTLTCFENSDGALLGQHRVTVSAMEPIGETRIRWFAPRRYSGFATSGLTETINKETESIQIELTWGNRKGPYVEEL